jgi:maltose-binding protein MalE
MNLRLGIFDFRFIFTLAVTIGLLIGCSSPAPTPTPEVAPTATEATTPMPTPTPAPPPTPTPDLSTGRLVLWHSWAEADGDALAQMLAAFQQQHPGVQVDTLFVAYNDLPQSYADAVRAGGGPDLILAPNWWLSDMVASGVVQPLGNWMTSGDLNAYWPATIDNLRRGGQLYGLPTHFELVSLFYNRALVTGQLPQTTDDLLKLAQADPHQGSGLYASLYHLYWGFAGYGAQLINDQGTIVLDQSDGAANFLTWLAALKKTPGSFVDPDYGMLLDRFKKGEFAFFVDGPWAIADLQGALGDNLGVTQLPAGSAGPAQPWLSADGVFLNPRSAPDQQQRALLLAQHLTSASSGEILARVAHHLPANRDAQVGKDALLQGFLQQAAHAQSMPTNPEMANVWGYGGDMLVKVLNNVGDPKSVVKETATLINEANGK